VAISGSFGSLNENFGILFQNSFTFSNLKGIFLKGSYKFQNSNSIKFIFCIKLYTLYVIVENFYEGYGNGYAFLYNCIIDQVIILMAKGTDRLTGIDSNYITEILNGQNSPPFQSQLNCIKGGLTEMQNEIKNARNLSKMFKKSFKVPQSKWFSDDFYFFFFLISFTIYCSSHI